MITHLVKISDVGVNDLMSIRQSYPDDIQDVQSTEHRYRHELLDKDNRVFFLSFNREFESLAYVQLLLLNADNDPDLANGKDIAHIHDLRVRNELQSNGIGRSLISSVEKEAKHRGIRILTLGVDNLNTRAIRFYKMLGYSEFKQTQGQTDDEFVICMRKFI